MSRPERALPWAPRPFAGEALGSWLGRLAAAYVMDVDEFAAYAGVSIDPDRARANWLALPSPAPADCERLAGLCRLPICELPAPYEAETPARLGYCHRCLHLNPVDVTAPYWQAGWLTDANTRHCAVHGQRYERTTLSAVREHRNMKRLLCFISRTRAAQERVATWQQWALAGFVTR